MHISTKKLLDFIGFIFRGPQVTTYFAKSSTFNEGARLQKIKCKSVYPKETACIEGSISVPDVPPTELGGCRLIHPNYGIMVRL